MKTIGLAVAVSFVAGSTLAQMNDDSFFIGTNSSGQTASAFVAATSCGTIAPLDLFLLGFPDLHVILTVDEGSTGNLNLSQNVSTGVLGGNSIQCGSGGIHAGHSFYRLFDLSTQGVNGDFEVGSVNVGIEISLENVTGLGEDFDGMQPLQCNFYWTTPIQNIVHDSVNGPMGMDAGFDFLIPADGSANLSVYNVPVSGVTVPSTATKLVVEIFAFGNDTVLMPNIDGGCDHQIGDVNRDGDVNILDIEPFVDALTNSFVCEADINEDGIVDFFDVAPFVELLLTAG